LCADAGRGSTSIPALYNPHPAVVAAVAAYLQAPAPVVCLPINSQEASCVFFFFFLLPSRKKSSIYQLFAAGAVRVMVGS
jgi:hypothetical protein